MNATKFPPVNQPLIPTTPIQPEWLEADTTFADHFIKMRGVPSIWRAWLRRMCKQGAWVVWLWISAIVFGLHKPEDGVDAELLTTYSEKMGFSAFNDHQKVLYGLGIGLE